MRIFVLFVLTTFLSPIKRETELGSRKWSQHPGTTKLMKTQGSTEFDNIHGSLQDKEGHLWFVTTGEGVYKYDGKLFYQFTKQNGLNSNTVWCVLEDNQGKLWFGTDDGVCVYDGKTFSRIEVNLLNKTYMTPTTSAENLASKKFDVWNIMQDKKGTLWFASTEGVFCYNGKSFSTFQVIEGANGFISNKVEYILEDRTGNIWFGGRGIGGVMCYDGVRMTNVKLDGNNWAWPVLVDKRGNIWFSNWAGAFSYDDKTISKFTQKNGLCSDNITQIIEDKNGNLWFGSESANGGICIYDGKTFSSYTKKDGLVNNSIWTILEDKSGTIWIGSRNIGLCKYDGKTFTQLSQ